MLTRTHFSMSEILRNIRLNKYAYALAGASLLFLCSQISIPLDPVPVTLQTFGIMLVALTFERRAAILSVFLYLSMAAVGIPVLAEFKGGIQYFWGSTGGYLIGFLAATAIMSTLKVYFKSEKLLSTALICLTGSLVIYVFGIAWLSHLIGFNDALKFGFFPFIIPGIIKIVLLSITLRYWKWGRI